MPSNLFKKISIFSILTYSMVTTAVYSAQRLVVEKNPADLIKITVSNMFKEQTYSAGSIPQLTLHEKNRDQDPQGRTHIRMQEYFGDYPILGAEVIAHGERHSNLATMSLPSLGDHLRNKSPSMTLSGILYQSIDNDLSAAPQQVYTEKKQQLILQTLAKRYQLTQVPMNDWQVEKIIYVDDKNIAHYAYHAEVKFSLEHRALQQPAFIIDALSGEVYQHWHALENADLDTVPAGGEGGNPMMGRMTYDEIQAEHHRPALLIKRQPQLKMCYMRNEKFILRDLRAQLDDVQFSCPFFDRKHPTLYWNGSRDTAGGGFSPSNDAFFAANFTESVFQNWYHLPVWQDKNHPSRPLAFWMHDGDYNASFSPAGYVILGDATSTDQFYPFTSVDVIAHELGHGFTDNHADLYYYGQSGALNESFSDMTAQAVVYALTGHNDWLIGHDILTAHATIKALRYMDQPSKDCESGHKPGDHCSIDNFNEYTKYLDVHYGSGLFNRAFYLLATSSGWSVKQAFDVMVQANRFYWTNSSSFCAAAHGVLFAAHDYQLDDSAIKQVFQAIGINTDQCEG